MTPREHVMAAIKATVARLDMSTVGDEDRWDEIDVDDIDKVGIIMDVEESAGIDISDEDAERAETVGDLIKLVETKLAEKN